MTPFLWVSIVLKFVRANSTLEAFSHLTFHYVSFVNSLSTTLSDFNIGSFCHHSVSNLSQIGIGINKSKPCFLRASHMIFEKSGRQKKTSSVLSDKTSFVELFWVACTTLIEQYHLHILIKVDVDWDEDRIGDGRWDSCIIPTVPHLSCVLQNTSKALGQTDPLLKELTKNASRRHLFTLYSNLP